MKYFTVEQFKAKNQIVVTTYDQDNFKEEKYFWSHGSVIVKIDYTGIKPVVYLDTYAGWMSLHPTTKKYRSLFLEESAEEIENKVKSREYILASLNLSSDLGGDSGILIGESDE